MINPQQPRERIKRPEIYNQPEPEEIESEELTQDDLNEWLTQKVIRLELETFRKEAKQGKSPLQKSQPVPLEKPKVKQPYEAQYGPQEVSPPEKKKRRSKFELVMLFVAICVAGYLIWMAYQYLVLGYTFGS